MLALVASLREEVSGLLRQMSLQETAVPRGWRLFMGSLAGRGVLVAQTGMGRDRAERAVQFLLDRYPLSCVISFGFAGALAPELGAGDLVVYREMVGPDGLEIGPPHISDPAMVDLAVAARLEGGIRLHCGCGLTLERLVSRPDEKGALGRTFGAMAVDMESYWVAAMATERRVPFLAVRAISDRLSQSLPPLDRFVGHDGAADWRGAVLHFASHPVDLMKMPGVFGNSRVAGRSLAEFLGGFVPRLPHHWDQERYKSA
jgi:adenosylhomocysteine nucleosidase